MIPLVENAPTRAAGCTYFWVIEINSPIKPAVQFHHLNTVTMFDLTQLHGFQWGIVPIVIFLRYFVMAGIVYLIFYVWKRREWFYLKIQQRFPHNADYRREIGYSLMTSLIFSAFALACLATPLRAYTQFYTDIHAHSISWLLLSIPLTVIVHDTYFYWAHRLMHHPKLYRHFHLVHHKSVNPSPWATFSFQPAEAVLEALIIPILLFSMPLHPVAFLSFVFIMLVFNVYGHLGYELYPQSMYRHPLGKWLNASIYHNLHHEKFTGNFGLYFTFWDRVCGTLRTDNEEKIERVYTQIAQGKEHAARGRKQQALDKAASGFQIQS